MSKTRFFPESNYAAIFDGQQTFRFEVDGPIQSPPFPEFYDIAINNLCYANCPYCYVSATKDGRNFGNVVKKIERYFGSMSMNERPFQVAIGGHGEPTLHPEFPQVLATFRKIGIVPNYTTNGTYLSLEVLEATRAYAGGVAVSAHPHLRWRRSVEALAEFTPNVHLHYIISDRASVDRFFSCYKEPSPISTYVLLPYRPVGRGEKAETDFDYLLDRLEVEQLPNVAYGAYFYEALKDRPKLNASLYEPHMFSRYLVLDEPVTEYKSSFDVRLKD